MQKKEFDINSFIDFYFFTFFAIAIITDIAICMSIPWAWKFLILLAVSHVLIFLLLLQEMDQRTTTIWLMFAALFLLPLRKKENAFQKGAENIWSSLSNILLCVIIYEIILLVIQRKRDTVDMLFAVLLFLELVLGVSSHVWIGLLPVTITFLLYLYCGMSGRQKGCLFVYSPCFWKIHYIGQNFYGFQATYGGKNHFCALSCSERKIAVKNELHRLCQNLRPDCIYITETHEKIIELISSSCIEHGLSIKTICKWKAPFTNKTESAFWKLYGDQWCRCKECCPEHPEGAGCHVTSPRFLEDKDERDTYIWIFYLKGGKKNA